MISSKAELRQYIEQDFFRNIGKVSIWKYLALKYYKTDSYMVFRYLKNLRKYEYAINCLKGRSIVGNLIYIIRKLKWRRLSIKYNLLLPPNVIGPGFKIAHIVGGGIIVNCKSIGSNCSVNSGVIIGNNGGQDRIATIGNNVSISIGAKVIGDVTIGDNVIVAPNSVVVKDIPKNCIVSGVPAKIIKRDGVKIV